MSTSRQQVLEYVNTQRAVTAMDVARTLRMTGANARHHLAILENQGLVETVGLRPASGRGRPSNLYSKSSRVRGDNIGELASAFLDEMADELTEKERERVLIKLAERMVGGLLENGGLPGLKERNARVSLTQRLFRSIVLMNDLNYQARWEAHAESPHVILGHCPYAAIIDEHPVLCQMDALLLEELLDAPVKQFAKMETDWRGLRYCAFAL
jgi:predicted ArsR family transcriptional regulator